MEAGQQHDAHEFLVELLNEITFMVRHPPLTPPLTGKKKKEKRRKESVTYGGSLFIFTDGNNQASPLTALIENTRACSQCDKV